MTKEYDAKSRPSTPEFRDNYDAIFRKAKKQREERKKEREKDLDDVARTHDSQRFE